MDGDRNDTLDPLRKGLSVRRPIAGRTPETLAFYRKYAFSFVKKTRVSWQYHEASARLISTWAAETEVNSYKTVRGEMKVAAGPSFHTSVQFNGILLAMP